MNITQENILDALKNIIEPDLHKPIVELGLVKDIKISNNQVELTVRVSNPAMHSKKRMEDAVEFALERAFGKEIQLIINIAGMETHQESPELRKVLPGVKNIIAVASGKGGVGKSTIAANLAVGLAKKGYSVGMIDADVYGPSMPTMLDVEGQKPGVVEMNGKQLMAPVETYGIKLMSIGFFADPDQPIVWRGSMATKALKQLISDTHWGDLDFMIIDLPPGTGDIHLTMVQALPLTGAVIVSTPQKVALVDARKGVAMFKLDNIKVPILGIIENMAWFTPEELPENKYYIFGKDGAQELAEKLDISLLGQLPLVQSVRESGDVGRPAILQENTEVEKLMTGIVDEFIKQVDHRNTNMPATKKVQITHG